MSFAFSLPVAGAAGLLQSALRRAAFAGIGFYVKTQKAKAGRRLVINEIPLGVAALSDQGALPQRFTVTAYFLGPGWLAEREALLAVLNASNTAQTLILPTKGPLKVRVGEVSYQDDEAIGAYGAVDIEFIQDNSLLAPYGNADFASKLLNNIEGLINQVTTAYDTLMGPLLEDAATLEYASSLLLSAGASLLSLPQALISGINASFAAAPANPFSTAAAVTSAYLGVSGNAAAAASAAAPAYTAAQPQSVTQPAALPGGGASSSGQTSGVDPVTAGLPASAFTASAAPNPVSGVTPANTAAADPSMGLAALCAWGAALPPPPLFPAGLGQAQAGVTGLVRQSAGVALMALYAQIDFANAAAADTARAQLTAALNAIGASIVDAGQTDLYRAWNALAAMAVQDMIARAQGLPVLAQYSMPGSFPDVVLAQRLLGDGSQGDALAALNAAIHPLFMPASGYWLETAP
ncbi:DNA circularization N-terminal domain-containing protein [Acidocella sp.]|uniref:DNA circularization N-terminal domain-containing protein n=1 Tax=Acidocella sp. TaxID=50710 RepID=UPI0026398B6A|nr:DNA circularization N-terminal domain-containing protein [Acidocella sp.]